MEHGLWSLPRRPHAKRILIHAINHVGLGHMNRAISVAQWLKNDMPALQALFLIEGGEDFIEPTGYPWIAIPGQPTEREQCSEIVRRVIEVFQPDLAIHETLLREQIHRPVRDAGLKQVLMGNVGELLRMQFRDSLSQVNEVEQLIILQPQAEVELADQELIAGYSGKTLYAGPIVRHKKQISGNNLRQKLGLTRDHKVIVLTLGGGGWDESRVILANLLASKERILAVYPETKLIVITGPHFAGELPAVDDFVCYASRFERFMTDFLDIATVVVSMAGYSTVNEVAADGIPTVCIPVLEADDQVGKGSMGTYAESFSNIVLSTSKIEELAPNVIDGLGRQRDLSATQAFWQRAGVASANIVEAVKSLL